MIDRYSCACGWRGGRFSAAAALLAEIRRIDNNWSWNRRLVAIQNGDDGFSGVAVIFTPYMLWHLVKARWIKSVVVFVVVVIAPFLASRFVSADASLTRFLLTGLPLVLFYIYTWILRGMIGEHLAEMSQARLIEYEHGRSLITRVSCGAVTRVRAFTVINVNSYSCLLLPH